MTQATEQPVSRRKRIAQIVAGVAAVCVVIGAVAYWLVVPGVADTVVRNNLETVEQKLGLSIEMREVATSGLSAVSLRGFTVTDPETEEVVAELGSVSASIDGIGLLRGRRELSSIRVEDATVYVRREADGRLNLERIANRGKSEGDAAPDDKPKPSSDASAGKKTSSSPGFLKLFGGQWPDVDVERARVVLEAAPEATPWPLSEVGLESLTVDGGEEARLRTELELTAGDANPRWSIPESVDVDATVTLPWHESFGSVRFSTPVEVVDLEPYPFVRLGLRGVAVGSKNDVSLEGLSVGVQGDGEPSPLARIEKIEATFRSLEPTLENLRPLEVRIEQPVLQLDYDAQYGSALGDLVHLMRAPMARGVGSRAKKIAEEVAEKRGLEVEEEEEDDEGGGLMAKLGEVDWTKFLSEQAPQSVRVVDAAVEMSDARPLALHEPDRELALRGGYFEFSHRAIHGQLDFKAGFEAVGDGDQPRGSVEAEYRWSYRDISSQLSVEVDALSLPWVIQMVDGDQASRLQAGTLRASLHANQPTKTLRTDISGLVSLEDATVHLKPVTTEPIEDLTASYTFEGRFNSNGKVPEPELLKERAIDGPDDDDEVDSADDDAEPEPRPPRRGVLRIDKATATLNGVSAEVRPALFGLDGLGRRPARFDLKVRLPTTEVQQLLDAVPEAIQGPITGSKFAGEFGWSLDLEVPLYRAAKMQWISKPQLDNFEILSLPEQVDVRKMRGAFEHTIYDPAIEWERTVDIPDMRPTPIEWLVRHSGLSAERFEERRRRRQWPPQYADDFERKRESGLVEYLDPYPAPWEQTEPAPRRDDFGVDSDPDPVGAVDEPEPEKVMVRWKDEEKEHPYGTYTYVPLQHISAWMVRAAMTTEDNSFFKHAGFNWHAIKGSVQANIEAGAYVRGASTISMQLVKNLFLNRDKVLARKLQEAFLVWVMEGPADIPKARILELYFNVIEYGPGIYGIHDAAVHYFGKRPDKLTLTEVAWLTSIVPNPKKYHFYYERGTISDAWFRRMLRYVRVMHNRGRVTELEYEMAKDAKPSFYKPADGEPAMRLDRPDDIEELDEDDPPGGFPGLRDFLKR
jgi:hypothetical protein